MSNKINISRLEGLGELASKSAVVISDMETVAGNANKFIGYDASGVPEAKTLSSSGNLIDMQVFTSSGTWTRPVGCTSVEVTVVGGGGGGHINSSGGGGGTAIKRITSVGSTVTVTVGAGGPYASAGGTSSFGSHCSATGGAGAGGTGGLGSGGDLNIKGNAGAGETGGGSYLGGGGKSGEVGGTYGGGGGASPNSTSGFGGKGVVIVKAYS